MDTLASYGKAPWASFHSFCLLPQQQKQRKLSHGEGGGKKKKEEKGRWTFWREPKKRDASKMREREKSMFIIRLLVLMHFCCQQKTENHIILVFTLLTLLTHSFTHSWLLIRFSNYLLVSEKGRGRKQTYYFFCISQGSQYHVRKDPMKKKKSWNVHNSSFVLFLCLLNRAGQ